MNEGFRSLPEDVQKKILGKAMGGVMQRPLFRQMGGPAQPMPQDMMPPAEPTAQAEMQGQAVGEEVAARTMGNIDAATDVKSAIDALRGNAAPIEARYQELANFVGERDAAQTPESVLALTQPAIMMTEQGAMDSGIGELMQRVAGDTQMDQGMDQGLGGLMMQGAGNTPPQNFRQGGPVAVRHFAQGTPSTGNSTVAPEIPSLNSFDQYMTRATDARADILGTPEERAARLARAQQSARSDAMFNLANFGLAFAGETQGNTVAERLANAATRSNVVGGFQQAGKDVAAARTLQDQQDQQMRLSALESAERQSEADQARKFDFAKMEYGNVLELNKMVEQNKLAVENAGTQMEHEEALNKATLDAREALQTAELGYKTAKDSGDATLAKELLNLRNQAQIGLFNLQNTASIENRLEEMRVQNVYALANMEAGTVQQKAILEFKDGLEKVVREDQQAFTAIQNALSQQNQFDLQKMRDEVTLEINNKNIDQKEKDRQLQHAQMMIDNAFKDHQLLQTDEQLSMQAARDLVDKNYKAASLVIEAQAKKLKSLEINNNNDLQAYISGETANGKMRFDEFIDGNLENMDDFETKLLKYTTPTKEWDESKKAFVTKPALKISERMLTELKAARPDLWEKVSGERLTPRNRVIPQELAESLLFKNVEDPAAAFGSGSFFKNLINIGAEAISLGYWGSQFPDVKEASTAVENLNNSFTNFFMKNSELRDSVFAKQELKDLTPPPTKFWLGDDTAASKARALEVRILEAEEILVDELNNESSPLSTDDVVTKERALKELRNLRAGYQMLGNISIYGKGVVEDDSMSDDEFDLLMDQMKEKNPKPMSLGN